MYRKHLSLFQIWHICKIHHKSYIISGQSIKSKSVSSFFSWFLRPQSSYGTRILRYLRKIRWNPRSTWATCHLHRRPWFVRVPVGVGRVPSRWLGKPKSSRSKTILDNDLVNSTPKVLQWLVASNQTQRNEVILLGQNLFLGMLAFCTWHWELLRDRKEHEIWDPW